MVQQSGRSAPTGSLCDDARQAEWPDRAASGRPTGPAAHTRSRGLARSGHADADAAGAMGPYVRGGPVAGGPGPTPRSLGQRDRRAVLVRASWLRGGTAADTASLHRPWPGLAPGAAAGGGRPDPGPAAGREGGPADAAGRLSRPAAHYPSWGLETSGSWKRLARSLAVTWCERRIIESSEVALSSIWDAVTIAA